MFTFAYFMEASVCICIFHRSHVYIFMFYESKCLQLHVSWKQLLIFVSCFIEASIIEAGI